MKKNILSDSSMIINELIQNISDIKIDNNYTLFESFYDNNIKISGKIPVIIKSCDKLNNLFDLKDINCNMINIPMIEEINIDYGNENITLNVKNMECIDNLQTNSNIICLPIKKNKYMLFKDIIINTNEYILSVCVYKLNKKINDITHGILFIFNSIDNNLTNTPNTIFFTKDNVVDKLRKDSDNIEYV